MCLITAAEKGYLLYWRGRAATVASNDETNLECNSNICSPMAQICAQNDGKIDIPKNRGSNGSARHVLGEISGINRGMDLT